MKISIHLFIISLLLNFSSNARPLKAAIFNIAPWGYLSTENKIAGIEYEIIKAISKELNEEIEIELVPYKRMMTMLERGDSDFSIFFRGEKSEEISIPLVKWGELDIIIIGRKGTKLSTYKDLKSKRIGVRLGGYFNEKFDNDKTIRKVSCVNYESCILKLKENKIDGIIGTAATLFYEFEKQKFSINQLGKPLFIGKKEDWLHFSRKFNDLEKRDHIKRVVHKLIKNGTFNKIFSTYLPKRWLNN